ncbi:MAG: hypothetical protein ACFWTN_11770 [Clostridium sp.]|jgi:flagellar biosynthesis/type III secretory pathway M-ring protein FliF/YscJ
MTKIFKVLPHMLIVLALVFIVIEVLDWYNPYMNFLGLNVSTILMIIFCLLSLVQSARMIFCERKLSELLHKKVKADKKSRVTSKTAQSKNQYSLKATQQNVV